MHVQVASAPLGIIAGAGRYPLALIRAARRAGRGVAVVALRRVTAAAVAQEATACSWLEVGRLEAAARFLRGCGATGVVLAGGVPWQILTVRPRLDRLALEALRNAALGSAGDDRLLRAVAAALESRGLAVVGPDGLAAGLVAGPGPLAGPPLPAALGPLVDRALAAAAELGRRDRGQAVVASASGVLLEGRAGTDALIRRAGRWRDGVLVKRSKPGQDLRFDLPAIGPATIGAAARAGLAAVVVEAGTTLILDRDETVALADRLGITLAGSPVAPTPALDAGETGR